MILQDEMGAQGWVGVSQMISLGMGRKYYDLYLKKISSFTFLYFFDVTVLVWQLTCIQYKSKYSCLIEMFRTPELKITQGYIFFSNPDFLRYWSLKSGLPVKNAGLLFLPTSNHVSTHLGLGPVIWILGRFPNGSWTDVSKRIQSFNF